MTVDMQVNDRGNHLHRLIQLLGSAYFHHVFARNSRPIQTIFLLYGASYERLSVIGEWYRRDACPTREVIIQINLTRSYGFDRLTMSGLQLRSVF